MASLLGGGLAMQEELARLTGASVLVRSNPDSRQAIFSDFLREYGRGELVERILDSLARLGWPDCLWTGSAQDWTRFPIVTASMRCSDATERFSRPMQRAICCERGGRTGTPVSLQDQAGRPVACGDLRVAGS